MSLNPYDFMHYQSGSSVSSVRKLLLGHCDVMRFGLGLASGEYIPWASDKCHSAWMCHTIQVRCLTCSKCPAGDHCAHYPHHRNKSFRERNNGMAPKALAMLTDVVNAQIDQYEACIKTCWDEEGTPDVRVRMLRFQQAKNDAQTALHAWLENPGSVDASERPSDAYPASSFFVLWPLTPEARGDGSTVVPYTGSSCREFATLEGTCGSRW